ncbi:uncharacterized protein LOC126378739 [Pectinophora gossypiella]|uniref:uncharacterized protein LOC126378739 n=1 Tax=Pectinophora gossypiella TaxID=13191 RepID=UPI00214EFB74|nr:uncharacterized protein LOC126378739 [Pectinophora gossypiella]
MQSSVEPTRNPHRSQLRTTYSTMALKMMQPGSHKLPRTPHHSVRFTQDDHKYKSLDFSQESPESGDSYGGPQSFPGQDSGAPSPDGGPYQPAALRLKQNEQRIKLLTSINHIVQQRAELESNRVTLSNLLDELRRKLKRRIEECHVEKKEKMKALKQANLKLEKERFGLASEVEHLKRHLEKEEAHHVQHARNAVAQAIQGVAKGMPSEHFFNPCSISDLPAVVSRNVAKNAPSRVADNKLAAARLMRDIAELRQRVAQVEARLANELKRKRQTELDIVRLRKELSMTKSSVAALRTPRPHCARFA